MSSLPPPALKRRRSERVGKAVESKVPGNRIAKASESTLDGCGPANVYMTAAR